MDSTGKRTAAAESDGWDLHLSSSSRAGAGMGERGAALSSRSGMELAGHQCVGLILAQDQLPPRRVDGGHLQPVRQ